MMKNRSGLSGIFPMLLLAVLAACVLTVLLAGADLYRGLAERDSEAYPVRTAGQYIAVKVRQAPGDVAVGDFDGCPALILTEEADGAVYHTRIYCHDGWLRELYAAADAGMTPADGEKLLELDSLTFSEENGLLRAVFDGREMLLHIGEEGQS